MVYDEAGFNDNQFKEIMKTLKCSSFDKILKTPYFIEI